MSQSPSVSSEPVGASLPEEVALKRELRLPDLIAMQVLLVFGATWVGTAGRIGSGHVVLWLAAIVTLFLPVAMVVGFCTDIWPQEGGVYQWTKHALGPFTGYLSAWNFGMWAILTIASLGIQIATTLHYAFGAEAAWMETDRLFETGLNAGVLAILMLINVFGFRYGRWVAHFGTLVTLMVVALAAVLLAVHPEATHAHPHYAPQAPFSLGMPALNLFTITIFSKLSFYGLTGLEQVAVFAGEMRQPRRNIIRSAWIAAPVIALLYIVTTGALLSYTPADKIDLTGPIPQLLSAGFGASPGAGHIFGTLVNLAFAAFLIAQYSTIIAEVSRLPMVAAWDHLFPAAFTRLHPRFRTPTLALAVVCGLAFAISLLAFWGAGSDEAFQVMSSSATSSYALYYAMMFLVPLLGGTRFSRWAGLRPGLLLRVASVSGLAVTALAFVLNLNPIVVVGSRAVFAAKIAVTVAALNAIGWLIYRRGGHAGAA